MRSPLVAIVGWRLPQGRVRSWPFGGFVVPETYVDALRRAGARVAIISGPEPSPHSELLESFDALLLAGGGDIDPVRYGAHHRHAAVYGVDPDRDELEISLVREALDSGMPTLAICRGIQSVNVAMGGTLHQHLPDVDGLDEHRRLPGQTSPMHDVKVAESSRIFQAAGRTMLSSWTSHHQGLDRLGDGLSAVAWTGDGLVEAVEHEDGWVVGVQWHPEQTAASDPAQQALFDALVDQARRRRAQRT
jgi:putative glutamine amidotransferase